ncbi:MAG: hypothetical protein R3F11_19695 [Verrucomicrobiales bacterium]
MPRSSSPFAPSGIALRLQSGRSPGNPVLPATGKVALGAARDHRRLPLSEVVPDGEIRRWRTRRSATTKKPPRLKNLEELRSLSPYAKLRRRGAILANLGAAGLSDLAALPLRRLKEESLDALRILGFFAAGGAMLLFKFLLTYAADVADLLLERRELDRDQSRPAHKDTGAK